MTGIPMPGIDLIKTFEGSRLQAYPDPKTGAEPITIGWGSTRDKNGRPFKLGDRITQAEADDLLLWQVVNGYLPPQERIPGWKTLNDNQKGAILSFAYNLGANFYDADGFETLSRVLRNQEWHNIEPALIMYRNPGSSVEEGLLRRRLSEANVFLAGTPGIALSEAGQKYLAGGRTPSSDPNLSQESQAYLANRPKISSGGGVPPAPGPRTLALTSPPLSGEDVRQVQTALVRWGAQLVPDGIFGATTDRAVRQFQTSRGLVADGVVGPQTLALLQTSPAPTPPVPTPPPTPRPPTQPRPQPQQWSLSLTSPPTRGEDVRIVQQALARTGIPLVADGIFATTTDRAVRQFQASRGLVADGVVGAQTWALLATQPAPTPPPQPRPLSLTNPLTQGDDVRAVQQALARAGIPVVVDGIFGPITDRALRQFQAQRGLVADGMVGAQTRATLRV